MKTTAERLGLAEKQMALSSALLAADPLGVIIRGHIYVENELVAFIQARMSPSEALDSIKLSFDDRVKLALALGLSHDFKSALTFLGSLRNKFAHRLDAKITEQEARDFEAAMKPAKEMVVRIYKANFEKLGPALQYRDPIDRVVLYLTTLWCGVAVAAARAQVVNGTDDSA